jgi:hypothetical protein
LQRKAAKRILLHFNCSQRDAGPGDPSAIPGRRRCSAWPPRDGIHCRFGCNQLGTPARSLRLLAPAEPRPPKKVKLTVQLFFKKNVVSDFFLKKTEVKNICALLDRRCESRSHKLNVVDGSRTCYLRRLRLSYHCKCVVSRGLIKPGADRRKFTVIRCVRAHGALMLKLITDPNKTEGD